MRTRFNPRYSPYGTPIGYDRPKWTGRRRSPILSAVYNKPKRKLDFRSKKVKAATKIQSLFRGRRLRKFIFNK